MDEEEYEEKKEFELPEPNPVTAAQHKRQFRQQILLPVLLGLAVLVGIIAWFWVAEIGTAQRWAEISTILMMIPLLLFGLVAMVLVILPIVLISEILTQLPPYTRVIQNILIDLDHKIKVGADISVKPILQVKSYLALIERITNFGRKPKEDA